MGKSKKNRIDVVYSTNNDFEYDYEEDQEDETLLPDDQKLRVFIEKKQRGGKTATIVKGFIGTSDDLSQLTKELKSKLGVGGSAKEGEIIIQGQVDQKVRELLIKMGYRDTK